MNNQEDFNEACMYGNIETFELLLADPQVDPSDDENWSIGWAACNGHIKVVELLLKDHRVDPSDNDNWAIRYAAYSGHINIVELLLKDGRVDPSANDNETIHLAAKNGYGGVIELLLEDGRVDPSDEVVEILLKDPRVEPNLAIRRQAEYGHYKVIEIIINYLVKKCMKRVLKLQTEKVIGRCMFNWRTKPVTDDGKLGLDLRIGMGNLGNGYIPLYESEI